MIDVPVLAHQVPENWRAQAEVFTEIFFVFLVIGTVVGVVVVAYTLYNGYKYRETDRAAGDEGGFEAPQLGELPTGQASGKSRKLFLSFGLSAIIVISLVVYSYGLLLYVEQGPSEDVDEHAQADAMVVNVTGYQFGWEFEYPNGHTTQNELRVPQGQMIRLRVTSQDVWHAFGVTDLRVKADAIPGQTDTTWFFAEDEGTYLIECFELCGVGHSQMTGDVIVMPEDDYEQWHAENAQGGSDDEEGSEGEQTETPGGEQTETPDGEQTETPEGEQGDGEQTATPDGGAGGEPATPTPTPGGDN